MTIPTDWWNEGSYFEACNCEVVYPCRTVGGHEGGRSTDGVCDFALSWLIKRGAADCRELDGLEVVMAGSSSLSLREVLVHPFSQLFVQFDGRSRRPVFGADGEERSAVAGRVRGRLPTSRTECSRRASRADATAIRSSIADIVTVR